MNPRNRIRGPNVFLVVAPFRTIFLAGSLASVVCGAPATASNPEEEFLRQVLARNPAVEIETLSVAGARDSRSGAVSLLLPQLTLSANAQAATAPSGAPNSSQLEATAKVSQYIPTGATLEGDLIASRTGFPDGGNRDTMGAGVSVTQPLLRGFGNGSATAYSVAQARSGERLQVLSGRASILALLAQARNAWWQQLARQAVLAYHAEDTLRTSRLLVAARQNFLAGSGSLLDTLQAYADHLQARSSLLDAWTQARSGAIDLGGYLDTTETWIPSDTSSLPPDSALASWPPLDTLLRWAEAGATDIAQALALEEKARSESLYRRSESLPDLDVGAFARHALVPGNSRPADNLGVQASFTWNLPDGLNRSAARKALLDLRKAGVQSVKARRDIRRTLAKLLDQAVQARVSLALQRQVLTAKEVQLRAAETGHRDGSVSWADYSTARRDWLSASAQVWSTVALAQQTESSLQSLTGTGPARLGWTWGE